LPVLGNKQIAFKIYNLNVVLSPRELSKTENWKL